MRQHLVLGDGWRRLWRHSYRLAGRWLIRDARYGWRAGRAGWARLLVPLDPWRYYELGRVADQPFDGDCLDVSSPKLLTSLLHSEGRGSWVGTDLFSREIRAWQRIDPALRLEVENATALSYRNESFDHVVCVSVLEHIGAGQDHIAMSEMWRVLRPGGLLHLTTDVANVAKTIHVDDHIYGEASKEEGGRVFFKRDFSPEEIDEIIRQRPWKELGREYVIQRRPRIESAFYAGAPWTYVFGPLLRWLCPANFLGSDTSDLLSGVDHGVIYLRLQKSESTSIGS